MPSTDVEFRLLHPPWIVVTGLGQAYETIKTLKVRGKHLAV
jgi:hypothetical protein